MAMDGCWEMVNLLSARIWLLRGCPCSNIHAHTSSPKYCGFKRKKNQIRGGRRKKQRVRDRLKERDGVNLIKIRYLHL